jgi:hypothetical protein
VSDLVPQENELTSRQWATINHPLVLTDTQAAMIACGYDQKYAQNNHKRFRSEFWYYIQHKSRQHLAALNVSQEAVMQEVSALAFSNLLDYFDLVDTDHGSQLVLRLNLKALPLQVQRCIKKIEFETVPIGDTSLTVVSKIELHDKLGALKELVEILQMRKPAGGSDPANALEHLEPAELDEIENVLKRAAARTKVAADKARDKHAIEIKT